MSWTVAHVCCHLLRGPWALVAHCRQTCRISSSTQHLAAPTGCVPGGHVLLQVCPAPGTRSWCLLRQSQGVLVGQLGESRCPARNIRRSPCYSSSGTYGLVSSPCCGITSASTILLPSAAHEPHAGLDCPPLWSQPLVGLPGSRSARRPRHHPHFHGPADHGCHP